MLRELGQEPARGTEIDLSWNAARVPYYGIIWWCQEKKLIERISNHHPFDFSSGVSSFCVEWSQILSAGDLSCADEFMTVFEGSGFWFLTAFSRINIAVGHKPFTHTVEVLRNEQTLAVVPGRDSVAGYAIRGSPPGRL
jgi:hypothetical protein